MQKVRSYQEEIGAVVSRLRLEKGWTQEELAKKAKTSQSAIHRIEKGQQNVSLDMIKRMSDCLGGQILSVNDSVHCVL